MNPEKMIELVTNLAATWGLKVIGVLVALFIGWIVANSLGRAVGKGLGKRGFDSTLTGFFGTLVRWGVLAAVIIGCLGVFGIQTASFAALIGAMGLALGLALQGTLGNFAAGVLLLVFRPFNSGDLVRVGDEVGKVVALELFTTTLNTPDNRVIIVPNGLVFNGVIENMTGNEVRRVDVAVGCDYSADIDKCREVLETVPPKVEAGLSDPAPQIFLKELGGSSVDWQVRVWAKPADYWTVYQSTIAETKKALDAAGIGIPFPQMDVHLEKLD